MAPSDAAPSGVVSIGGQHHRKEGYILYILYTYPAFWPTIIDGRSEIPHESAQHRDNAGFGKTERRLDTAG
jgi:hypothetical protein